MSKDLMREQFEERYPVPEGCCWNAEQGRYVLFHLKLCAIAKYERFVESWVCWQASREAVVVELPPPHAWDNDGALEPDYDPDAETGMALIPRIDARIAIEAQGLKVAP